MEFKLAEIITEVKLAVMNTAASSDKRRLRVFKSNIKCYRGCSACCSRLIKVTMAEALILYDYLYSHDNWQEVKERAEAQLDTIKLSSAATWFMMNKPCPVLGKNLQCLGYPVRPVLCSTHFVLSDPTLCSSHNLGSGKYEEIQFNDLVESFLHRLMINTAGSGILQFELPLQSALLLSERINIQAGLDLDKVISLFFNEL